MSEPEHGAASQPFDGLCAGVGDGVSPPADPPLRQAETVVAGDVDEHGAGRIIDAILRWRQRTHL